MPTLYQTFLLGSFSNEHLIYIRLILFIYLFKRKTLRLLFQVILLLRASTIWLRALCPSLLPLLPLLLISIHIYRYAIHGRCLNISQHKVTTASFPFDSICVSLFFLFSITAMDITTSALFPSLLFYLFIYFISHVWRGCPAEDDLSGQSYQPFGTVRITTMEQCTHLRAHGNVNVNVHTDW